MLCLPGLTYACVVRAISRGKVRVMENMQARDRFYQEFEEGKRYALYPQSSLQLVRQ